MISNLFSSATSSNAVLRVAPLRLDPIAHWTLDEGSGAMAADASGNGHDAALVNGPAWASGIVSNALMFDEVDDRLLAPDFDYDPDFSISFWFRAAELEGNGFQYIISHAAYNTAHSVNICLGESSATSGRWTRTAECSPTKRKIPRQRRGRRRLQRHRAAGGIRG